MDMELSFEPGRLERTDGFIADDMTDEFLMGRRMGTVSRFAWAGALVAVVCVILTLV